MLSFSLTLGSLPSSKELRNHKLLFKYYLTITETINYYKIISLYATKIGENTTNISTQPTFSHQTKNLHIEN